MNETDRKRFNEICRRAQYGATLKELAWLIALVVKLDKAPTAEPEAAAITKKRSKR